MAIANSANYGVLSSCVCACTCAHVVSFVCVYTSTHMCAGVSVLLFYLLVVLSLAAALALESCVANECVYVIKACVCCLRYRDRLLLHHYYPPEGTVVIAG